MSRTTMLLSCLAVLVIAVGLSGCGSSTDPATTPASDQPPPGDDADHMDMDHADMDHADAGHADHADHGEYAEAFADLSEADCALAEKQKVCPVSDAPLGSMGKPYKVTVNGQEVMLCCKGCEAKIKADPEKYLAKLPK